MSKAVQLSAYGGLDRLEIVDVEKPAAQAGEVVVRVIAAGTNPGEIAIREGALKNVFPMEFPFGQGTDFAGRVDSVGAGVTEFAPGDAVLGWSKVVATTAVAAVRAVSLKPGETVAISGAAGGVLRSVGVEPLAYGDALAERLRAATPNGLAAFIDLFGGGYIELAVTLGVAPQRINTIIDFAAAQKAGAKTDGGSAAPTRETLASVANAIAWGDIVMPLSAIYPFAMVREAYTDLARRKAHGKIVLALDGSVTAPLRPAQSAGLL